MKKLLLTAFAVTCAVSVFAQGTVQFNNRVSGALTTHVYIGAQASLFGNGPTDNPAGTYDWTGYTLLTGSGFRAAILGANGAGVAADALSFGATPTTTSFRTGTSAGGFAITTATLGNVAQDAATATLQIFAWDARTGIVDPVAALSAFRGAQIAGGFSPTFNVNLIGGLVNTPPTLAGLQSFSIAIVPEPSTMALAGLAAASLLIFRRRK